MWSGRVSSAHLGKLGTTRWQMINPLVRIVLYHLCGHANIFYLNIIKVKHIKNKSFMNCVLLLKGRNMHLRDLFNLKPAFQHQRSMRCLIKLCSIDFSSQVHQRIHFSPSNDAEPKVLLWSTLIFTWSLQEDSDLMNCK